MIGGVGVTILGMVGPRASAGLLLVAGVAVAGHARAGDGFPPWAEDNDVPLPSWVRTAAPRRSEVALFADPGRPDTRRGSTTVGIRLPLFASRRGDGCAGRWLLVGPEAWVCSDAVDLSAEEPDLRVSAANTDALPYRYFFVGDGGASAFTSPERALEGTADRELEAGFAVAIAEERAVDGQAWGRTRGGEWIALHELVPARPSTFQGDEVKEGHLTFGWVTSDRAQVTEGPRPGRGVQALPRFTKVVVQEEKGAYLRISPEGEPPRWVSARDIARPTSTPAPVEVDASRGERWIDVDLARQVLVAYEGARPVFATLVSTGAGPQGSDTATPRGVHRVWVKLLASTMSNVDRDDADRHYSLEDVPYVQFFDKAVALHGVFWHRDFGRPRSHGCVNLAPRDAAWLFRFTGPHVPPGWTAVLPTLRERGTAVQVR